MKCTRIENESNTTRKERILGSGKPAQICLRDVRQSVFSPAVISFWLPTVLVIHTIICKRTGRITKLLIKRMPIDSSSTTAPFPNIATTVLVEIRYSSTKSQLKPSILGIYDAFEGFAKGMTSALRYFTYIPATSKAGPFYDIRKRVPFPLHRPRSSNHPLNWRPATHILAGYLQDKSRN